jgi:hypothetical protein
MPIWTVGIAEGEDERIEADLLATDGGALVAMSEEGLLLRAWAPGQWRTVGHVTGVDAHPAGKTRPHGSVVVGLPSR